MEGDRIYVGNLNPDVTKQEVEDLFAKYGKVARCFLARNPPGFAFVSYEV